MTKPEAELLFWHEVKRIGGLDEWSFGWLKYLKRFRRAGQADHKNKVISLAPEFVRINAEEQILNTIRHEIAHALHPKDGHNKFWKNTFLLIGGSGERCYGEEVFRSEHEKINALKFCCEGLRLTGKLHEKNCKKKI